MYEPLMQAISAHNVDPAACSKEVRAVITAATGYNEMQAAIDAARDFLNAAVAAESILGRMGRAQISVNALNHHMAAVSKTVSALNYRTKVLCAALDIEEVACESPGSD